MPVAVVDLPGAKGLAGIPDFIAGREQRHPKAEQNRDRLQPDAGQPSDVGWPDTLSGLEQGIANADVLTRRARVGTDLEPGRQFHRGAGGSGVGKYNVFVHEHRIRARRQHRTGEDAPGVSGR